MSQTVTNLVNTSLEDCRVSLTYITDLSLLRRLQTECTNKGLASRAKLAERRIKQLKKEAANG